MARIKAENAVLPVYRKELRKVLLENLQWMRAMKKDPTLKKVVETQIKELKDSEGFDWLESTELLSISENSYSFDCTKSSPFHKMKTRPTMNVIDFFSWTFVLLRFNKNCKQPHFKCVLSLTSQSLQPFVYTGCCMKFIIPNKLVSLI